MSVSLCDYETKENALLGRGKSWAREHTEFRREKSWASCNLRRNKGPIVTRKRYSNARKVHRRLMQKAVALSGTVREV